MKQQAPIPPRIPYRLLAFFLRNDLLEDVSGDLEEKYITMRKSRSRAQADLHYWYEVLHYVRPFAIRKFHVQPSNAYPMYKSYLLTAFRSMTKNKIHAFINIVGLSIGMAVAMIIGLWIYDELSYERNFDNHAITARVIQNVTNNGETDTWWTVPYPLADELRKNYGENFKYVALTSGLYDHLLTVGKNTLTRSGIFAEPDFTTLFTLKMIKGNRQAIKDPSTILIAASTAQIYFGDGDPMGQVIVIDKETTVHVGGVYEDIPEQSTFGGMKFVAAWDLLYSESNWIKNMTDPWRPNAFCVYVGVADNFTFDQVSRNIKDAKLRKVSAFLAKMKPELFLLPMDDWHLRAEFREGKYVGGRIQYVWLFGVVGVFVVLMACINFMNLSTARSEKRAKEVGIRKAIGSVRSQLMGQFFSESILIAFLSFIIAVILVQVALPVFNEFAGKHMSLSWSSWSMWLVALSFCVAIGIVAGSYPALYLSSIKPSRALKGVFKASRAAGSPRKVLVVVQFTVSVALICGTWIVFKQIQFAKDRPIGYSTSGLIAIPLNGPTVHDHFDVIRNELIGLRAIEEMGEADAPTTDTWSSSSAFDWDGKDPDLSVDFSTMGISYDYGKTIGWHVIEGRDFSREFLSDTVGVIVNRAAIKYIGLKEPIGSTIRWSGQPFTILGVIDDIVVGSPYEPVKPLFYFLSRDGANFALIRLSREASAAQSIAVVEKVFKRHNPEQPFDYQFMDESYGRKFGNEERVGKLAGVFTALAIFISCLGIFGLSSFVAEQRTKEIGVRKVMGASILDVWRLISKEFLILVSLSCVAAVPLAYFVLSSWLSKFQYHMEVSVWVFAGASVFTILITIVTVSWHTLAAASANPVKSLRSE